MKRLTALLMILVLLCPCACAVEMANPWTETTAEEMVEKIGLSFHLPEEAENIVYRMLESEALAETQFVLDGVECIARIKAAVEFEDISGLYYEWEHVEDCEILWCPGQVMETAADGQKLSLCLWYDVVPGLMYSVSAVGETDIAALANALFMPAQGDVDASPADVLAQKLMGCTGYEGTAGSSLKEAIAATELLSFAVEYAGVENLEEISENAMNALSEEQAQELAFSMEGIRAVIESAFDDYDSIAGLFDDAGVGEWMQELIQAPDAQVQWKALSECIKADKPSR